MAKGNKIEGGLMRNGPAIGIVWPPLAGGEKFNPAKVAPSEKGRKRLSFA